MANFKTWPLYVYTVELKSLQQFYTPQNSSNFLMLQLQTLIYFIEIIWGRPTQSTA